MKSIRSGVSLSLVLSMVLMSSCDVEPESDNLGQWGVTRILFGPGVAPKLDGEDGTTWDGTGSVPAEVFQALDVLDEGSSDYEYLDVYSDYAENLVAPSPQVSVSHDRGTDTLIPYQVEDFQAYYEGLDGGFDALDQEGAVYTFHFSDSQIDLATYQVDLELVLDWYTCGDDCTIHVADDTENQIVRLWLVFREEK